MQIRHSLGARALRTLAVAGEHLNFTRAADALGLTPAAVSYQIKEIEEQIGVQLFVRTSRSIRLTEAGSIMFEAAQDALRVVDRAIAAAQRTARGKDYLKITMDPQFATKWLMRRVDQFRSLHPDIELRFDVSYQLRDFELDEVDVAIRFGTGRYPDTDAYRLFENMIVPVCSPRLLASGKQLKEPRDLKNHTLAHIEWSRQGITWPNWRMWMAAAGIKDFDESRMITFGSSSEAIEAALAGEAVALADFAMVATELSDGKLIRPFELSIKVPSEFGYFLIYPKERSSDTRIAAFREWLLSEAAEVKV